MTRRKPQQQDRAEAVATASAQDQDRPDKDSIDTKPEERVGAPSDKVSQGSSGSDPDPDPDPDLDLAAQLHEAETKRDEYLADLQRLAAEFENYRKRAARDQERLVAHAHERLVRELLPVLDDLERTLEAAEQHEKAALSEGVRFVERSLRKALEKEGVAEIDASGSFDPHVHEALMTQARDDAEPGSVVEVVQRGYRMGDKVVRPARVIVAE